jgi:hypothetical protein
VGLERGPLSLVSRTEELLERKSNGSNLENRDNGRRVSAALTTRHSLSAKFGTVLFDKETVIVSLGNITGNLCNRETVLFM